MDLEWDTESCSPSTQVVMIIECFRQGVVVKTTHDDAVLHEGRDET